MFNISTLYLSGNHRTALKNCWLNTFMLLFFVNIDVTTMGHLFSCPLVIFSAVAVTAMNPWRWLLRYGSYTATSVNALKNACVTIQIRSTRISWKESETNYTNMGFISSSNLLDYWMLIPIPSIEGLAVTVMMVTTTTSNTITKT